ncbi:mucin-2-like isoform X2 [Pleurodeles waltl]|uniref:mucin-2-like isoform X2 n=1 Tax=Pleurodeles waltl TaxID=8319 RepID=UPI0037095FF2
MWIACLAWIALIGAAVDAFSGRCTQFPSLCCKGVDSTCRRGDCYCDSYCLTNYDCCPDFSAACNGVTQAPPPPPIAADVPVQVKPDTTLATTSPQSTSTTTSTTMTTPTTLGATITKNVPLPLNASQTTTTAIQPSSTGPTVPGNASTAVSTSISQSVGGNTTSTAVLQGQQATTGSNTVSQTSFVNATTVTTFQITTTTLLGASPNKTSNASQSIPTTGPGTFSPTGSGNVSVAATSTVVNQTNTTSTAVSVAATSTVVNQTNTTSTAVTAELKNPNTTQAAIQVSASTVTPALSMLSSSASTTAQLNITNGMGVTQKDAATGSPLSAPLATSNQSTTSGPTASQSFGINSTTVASVQMVTTTLLGVSPNKSSNASEIAPTAGSGTLSTSGPGQVSVTVTSTGAKQTNTASPLVTGFQNPNSTQASILGNASSALTASFIPSTAVPTTDQINITNGTGATWKDPATVSLISGPGAPSNQSATSGPAVSQVSFVNSSTLTTVQMAATTLTATSPNKTLIASQPTPTATPTTFSTFGSGNVSVAAISLGSNQTNTTLQAVTGLKNPNITQGDIQVNTSAVSPTSNMPTFAGATTVKLSNTNGTEVTGKGPSTASFISALVILLNQSTTSGPTGPQVSVTNVTTVATTQIVAFTLLATSLNKTASSSQSIPPAVPVTSTTSWPGMWKTDTSSGTNQTNTSTAVNTEYKSPNTIQANASATPSVWSMLFSGATTTPLNTTSGTGTTGKDPATGPVIAAPVVSANQSTTAAPTGPQTAVINSTTVTAAEMTTTTSLGTPPNTTSSVSQSMPTVGPGTFSTPNSATPVATALKSLNTTIQTNTSVMPPALSMLTSSAATTNQLNNTNGTGVTGNNPATWSLISAPGASSNQSTTSRVTGPQGVFVNATTVAIAQVVATNFTANASQSVSSVGPGTFPTPGSGQESTGANQTNPASPPVTAFSNTSSTHVNTSSVPAASSALNSAATVTAQLNNTTETGITGKDSATASRAGGSNQSVTTGPTGPSNPAANLPTEATSPLNASRTAAVIPDHPSGYTVSANSPTGGTPKVEQLMSSAPLYTGFLMTKSSSTNQTRRLDSTPTAPAASLNPTKLKQQVKKSQVITIRLDILRKLPFMSILEIEKQLLEKVRTLINEKFPNMTISTSMRIKEKRVHRLTAW